MRHIRTTLLLVALLLAALAPAAAAEPAQPNASSRIFMPAVFTVAPGPALATIPFWAEQYTLSAGTCTTLRWRTENAKAVYLDGNGVPASGSQQVCPTNNQFYILEIVRSDDTSAVHEIVLSANEPFLLTDEVLAKGVVSGVTPVVDVDPKESGNQPGYHVGLANVTKLWAFSPAWNEPAVTLGVPQEAVDLGASGPLHWPLRTGQRVEFYAVCQGSACLLDFTSWHYLYVTSE